MQKPNYLSICSYIMPYLCFSLFLTMLLSVIVDFFVPNPDMAVNYPINALAAIAGGLVCLAMFGAIFYIPCAIYSYFKKVRSNVFLLIAATVPFGVVVDNLEFFINIASSIFILTVVYMIFAVIKSFIAGVRYLIHRYKIKEILKTNSKGYNPKFTLQYLKQICTVLIENGDTVSEIVLRRLEQIESSLPKLTNTLMYSYLCGKLNVRSSLQQEKSTQPVFPFGFNSSQKLATQRALNNKLSIIQGPPGTGKTQTILNIISNAIMENKSVAILSNNNSATDNIFEKLKKNNLDFLAAPLGSNKNQTSFFEDIKRTYLDISDWHLPGYKLKYCNFMIRFHGAMLDFLLKLQNKQALLSKEYSQVEIESTYFISFYDEFSNHDCHLSCIPIASPSRLLKLSIVVDECLNNEEKASHFSTKVIALLCGIKLPKVLSEEFSLKLKQQYYNQKKIQLNFKLSFLNKVLKGFSFEKQASHQSTLSLKLLKGFLASKYKENQRPEFSMKNYKYKFKDFIQEYPIILSSTHSLTNSCPEDYLFDYVIIDEASQVDLRTGVLAFSCAKNAIVVGDSLQLPHVIQKEDVLRIEKTISNFNLVGTPYEYFLSFLDSLSKLFPQAPSTLLREHYRCDPQIIEFCNTRFYNGELICLTKPTDTKPIFLYKTAPGNHQRGTINKRQIDVIFNEIIPQNDLDTNPGNVGILTPYRKQVNKILGHDLANAYEVDTVHKFQGREKEIIIMSTVLNKDHEFISNPQLLNVAVSRAIKQLYVVVAPDDSFMNGSSPLSDLVKYIQYNNFDVIDSKIYSIFDMLYSNYSDALLKYHKRLKNVSEYKSENLMNIIIEEVLTLPRFQHLGRSLHIPLRYLFKDLSYLTPEEAAFVSHPNSHVDFLIYNKTTKVPVLAIEVNGHKYHEENPEQKRRDALKYSAFEKSPMELKVFETTESEEKERLIGVLDEMHMIKQEDVAKHNSP